MKVIPSKCDITVFLFYYAVASELEQLFVKQSSLEVYFEWLDSLIERRVFEVGTQVILVI